MCPRVLTYRPAGELEEWQVQEWELLSAEFSLEAGDAPSFHGVVSVMPRSWMIVRRLYGVAPLFAPAQALPEDLTSWSPAEVCQQLGIERGQLQSELDLIRGVWRGKSEVRDQRPEVGATPSSDSAPPADLLEATGEGLLEAFDFPESLFDFHWEERLGKEVRVVGRRPEDERRERNWFLKRLQEMERMFREPRSAPIARLALMNELWLRRYESQRNRVNPIGPEADQLAKRVREIQEALQSQLQELDELFPELGLSSKVKFKAVLSDLVVGVWDYYAKKDNRLVSYLGTAAEIEVQLRGWQQAPEPQYRLDAAVAAQEAAAGLFDPKFRSLFKPQELKKLQAGHVEGVKRAREETGEVLLDMEDDSAWPEDAGLQVPSAKGEGAG